MVGTISYSSGVLGRKMVKVHYELQCPTRSYCTHMAPEHFKCGWSQLGCIVNIKYTSDFEDLIPAKEYKISH